MVHPISPSHTFLVRIWREKREIPGAAPEWRGAIEHIPGGETRYFRKLEEITQIIQEYLAPDIGPDNRP